MQRKIRKIRIEGHLAYIPLTKGYEVTIDAADVPLVDGFNWCAMVTPHTIYAYRADYTGPQQRTVYMHRVIKGEPDDLEVGHEDGDGLNNRRKNLREATTSQNQHNARVRKDNTSGFKGVTLHKRAAKWRAQIKLGGNNKYLGLFGTPGQAHAAYREASAKLHGEFGRNT